MWRNATRWHRPNKTHDHGTVLRCWRSPYFLKESTAVHRITITITTLEGVMWLTKVANCRLEPLVRKITFYGSKPNEITKKNSNLLLRCENPSAYTYKTQQRISWYCAISVLQNTVQCCTIRYPVLYFLFHYLTYDRRSPQTGCFPCRNEQYQPNKSTKAKKHWNGDLHAVV